MKYHIYRTHLSGYWPKNFLELEAAHLSKIDQCTYHGLCLDARKWQNQAIILSNTHFKPELITNTDWAKVSLVLHANSGFDNIISKSFLDAYKGPILIAPTLRAQAVAEYNLQAWLGALGQIPFKSSWDNERSFIRRLANNQKVLIIGFGHVGKLSHQMIQATGASVDVYDPYIESKVANFVNEIKWEKYNSIIFCCSLTQSSQKLLSDDVWKKLSSEIIIINSARGGLVNLNSAIKFASNNLMSKIIIDVFEKEPFNDHGKLPANIYTSSHIAGVYDQLLDATHDWHIQMIKDFLANNLKHDLRQQRLDL